MIKLGVSAFGWNRSFDKDHFKILPSLKEHGFEGFEVPIFDPAEVPAAEIRKALEENGLECTVCSILPSGINPISPDPAIRRKSQLHLVRCIEIAAELGAKRLGGPVYAPIGYLPGRRRSQEEWNWAVECLQSLGEVLDANDITLALEPVNRSETFFLTTAQEAKTLSEDVGHSRIAVLMDTFHSNIEEKSIPAAILSLGSRLVHVHASENDRGIPGTGHVDFAGIIGALRRIDYQGYLVIEGLGFKPLDAALSDPMWRRPQESPEAIAFDGIKFLRGLLAQ